MKKIILITLLSAFTRLNAQNGVGKMFPTIKGETFTEKGITIPDVCKGKSCIIAICFSKNAEGDMQSWLNPAYNEFVVKKDTTNAFGAAVSFDINFYFMPKFNLINQVLEKASKEKIKSQTDASFWPHLFFCTDGIKEIKKFFGIEDTSQPYFFVLDKDGKVVHVEKGVYSAKRMSAIQDFLD